MEPQAISEHFPLFNPANPETIERLLSTASEEIYPPNQEIIKEDDWGKTVNFIVSGWVKIYSLESDRSVTLEILGRGDFFGEIAVLEESLPAIEAIALSEVHLLSISAQRFLQLLFKDPQLHHRMLQLTVSRVRQLYRRFQLLQQPPKTKLIKTLINLAQNYGQITEQGTEIFNISAHDLADLASIEIEDSQQILSQLQNHGWLEIDSSAPALYLTNIKKIHHFAKQL